MRASKKLTRRFRVGDWVCFDNGLRRVTAKVVEDRGALGVRGRRLYRVRPMPGRDESLDFEIPEEELEAATGPMMRGPARPASANIDPRIIRRDLHPAGRHEELGRDHQAQTGYGADKARARGGRIAKWEENRNRRDSQSSTCSWRTPGNRDAVRSQGRPRTADDVQAETSRGRDSARRVRIMDRKPDNRPNRYRGRGGIARPDGSCSLELVGFVQPGRADGTSCATPRCRPLSRQVRTID